MWGGGEKGWRHPHGAAGVTLGVWGSHRGRGGHTGGGGFWGEGALGVRVVPGWGWSWDEDAFGMGMLMAWGCFWDALGLGMLMFSGCFWDRDAFGMEIFMVWGCSCFRDAYGFGMLLRWGCSWDALGLGMLLGWDAPGMRTVPQRSQGGNVPTAMLLWDAPGPSRSQLGRSQDRDAPSVGCRRGWTCPRVRGIHPQVGDASRSVRIHMGLSTTEAITPLPPDPKEQRSQ